MTFEEFESLAMNPPHRDEETVFEVTEYDVDPLPERKRCHYPRFGVISKVIGFARTLKEAESLIKEAIKKASEYEAEIYCFYITEYPAGVSIVCSRFDLGISCHLYDSQGYMLDRTYCSSLDRDFHTVYGKFKGRPDIGSRIKAGDIVEILNGDEVTLGIANSSGLSIEDCWAYRERIGEFRQEQNFSMTDDDIEKAYMRDCSDDQITVIDGPYGSHDHISPLFIQSPRYAISKTLSSKLRRYASSFYAVK